MRTSPLIILYTPSPKSFLMSSTEVCPLRTLLYNIIASTPSRFSPISFTAMSAVCRLRTTGFSPNMLRLMLPSLMALPMYCFVSSLSLTVTASPSASPSCTSSVLSLCVSSLLNMILSFICLCLFAICLFRFVVFLLACVCYLNDAKLLNWHWLCKKKSVREKRRVEY